MVKSVSAPAFAGGGVASRLSSVIARSEADFCTALMPDSDGIEPTVQSTSGETFGAWKKSKIATKQSIKSAAVIAAIAGMITFGAPANAEVEYIPNPSSIVTNDFFTLGTPTTTKPSGSYVVLSAVDKATNPWTVTDGYSTFTLNKTSYIYGGESHDLSPVNVNVPNTDAPVALTVKYETSEGRVGDMTSDIGSASGPTTVFAELSDTNGGAIYNSGAGDYSITNTAFLNNSADWGGAIINWSGAKLGDITNSIFINNTSTTNAGGAIYNYIGTMGDIKNSTFISNSASYGGAIYNYTNAQIGDITNSNFINNDASTSGGVIYNSGKFGNITKSTFISNSASYGGAIYNYTNAQIGDITNSTFINNSANYGGAIYNNTSVQIGDITNSYFINNSATSGGAIYNAAGAQIGNITNSNFTNNSTNYGGAINNRATIGDITNSNFINNDASTSGGAIYNHTNATIGDITNSTFINNSANYGGAIYNYTSAQIGDITNSYFINNSATSGGTIYNAAGAQIGNITNSNFINNSANYGGAIYNYTSVQIGDITNSTFINNSANYGGAIFNNTSVQLGDITNSTFISNSASVGGVIASVGIIKDIINSTFISNSATTGAGGAGVIYNEGSIGNINSKFINNSANYGGAIGLYTGASSGYISKISDSLFDSNNAGSQGGAIYYDDDIVTIDNIINSTFINNTAGTQGGAILAKNNVKITSDGGTTLFQGNTDSTGSNAIYMDNAAKTVTFDHKNGGKTYMYDVIDGAAGYAVDIKGNGTMYLFNDINNANVSIGGVELNTINNNIHTYNFDTLNLTNDFNMAVDVDLANESMDRLTASTYNLNDHNVNVIGMNLLSDAKNPASETRILFADSDLKANVNNMVAEAGYGTSYQTTAFAPIYKYNVNYDPASGYYSFATGGGGGSDSFNPAVLAEPVAAQANIMAINNIVTNYAFHHADTCMGHAHGHLSSRYLNRYAIAETDLIKDDLNTNNPLFIEPDKEAVWVKPFVTFENIPLKNGPKVNNITYGTLIGFDSPVFHHKRGWDGVWTGYVGYNGSNMHYSGVDSTSNGGLLGATYSLYKGNFFNATTLTTGAMHTQARTMYGNDNMTSLYAGVGNKTGYNFNFKEGLFTIQPSFLISYTFGKTFDYTNAAGVRINSDPIHAIQLSPGIKFYMNTKSGWQPYIGVNMMWNIMDQTHARANGVKLPEMSVKPYIQYGIGVQKVMKDHFTAYGQAMIQNGGRNGVSLTAGFKWALGRNKKPHTVKTNGVRTVLK